ncbi:MAG TPA: hypothetical protein EYP52_10765 [Anaerolineae bacterium]|nr:hypothetical protein [Anaerolineae bacterium]
MAPPNVEQELLVAWENGEDEDAAENVRDIVHRLGGIAYTLGEIFRYVERALSALSNEEEDHLLGEWLLALVERVPGHRGVHSPNVTVHG